MTNRKCYSDLNNLSSKIFNIGKGVPQGFCLGLILFLLFNCTLAQELRSATQPHLVLDDLAIIINASLWWYHHGFYQNMQHLGQRTLKQLQLYVNT